jgi:opacity protein-like surface antigen
MKTMKCIALCVAMLTVFAAQAQFTIRPQVGVNSSSLSSDDNLIDFNAGTGFQVGVDFQIGNKVYFQPGIQLEFLKNQVEIGSGAAIEESDYDRTGIRVPLMIGFRAVEDPDSDLNLRLFTGPNALLQLSQDSDESILDDIDDDDLKDLVFGWNVGAGVDFSILFFDIGYQFGISEIFNDADSAPRNNLFYGNLGLRINL